MLIAMLAYHIELDLSFLPEPSTAEERETVSEKGARRFDRFEQWLVRHLVDPDNLYSRLQRSTVPIWLRTFRETRDESTRGNNWPTPGTRQRPESGSSIWQILGNNSQSRSSLSTTS